MIFYLPDIMFSVIVDGKIRKKVKCPINFTPKKRTLQMRRRFEYHLRSFKFVPKIARNWLMLIIVQHDHHAAALISQFLEHTTPQNIPDN